jgi:hypothetical protein
MARRIETDSLTLQCNGLLHILRLSEPVKANGNTVGEVIQRCEAMRMTWKTKIESFTVQHDGILHLSSLIKRVETALARSFRDMIDADDREDGE